MSGLEGLFAIVIVALMPVALVFITRYYALREKELMTRSESNDRRLEQLLEDRLRLEARVENLESIICTADFELDQRLQRLSPPAPRSGPRALLSSTAVKLRRRPGSGSRRSAQRTRRSRGPALPASPAPSLLDDRAVAAVAPR